MQIIVQVSQQGHRPDVPADCPPFLAALLQRCWSQDPQQRCAGLLPLLFVFPLCGSAEQWHAGWLHHKQCCWKLAA